MHKNGNDGDDDDDGESLTGNAQRIEKLLQSYASADGDKRRFNLKEGCHDSYQSVVDTLRVELSQQFSLTCLICLDRIDETSAIWNCRSCRCVYHLQCAQLWANESAQKSVLGEENSPSHGRNDAKAAWCCPKCRLEYGRQEMPKEYKCFCGKTRNPAADLWLPPHSCGLMCKRPLACKHQCLLLCHPGPCPPCPKIVEIPCFCTKSAPKAFRCHLAKWSCQKICQKTLLCGKHRCALVCHEGKCRGCSETFVRSCLCGKRKAERPCAESAWLCSEPCEKILQCKKHRCVQPCHNGPCGPCAESNSLRCPCGKTPYESGKCIDDLKCCGDTCGKFLDCGLHNCVDRCHRGPCGTCNQMRVKRCRCGAKEKEYPCGKELLCEIKCKNKRPCGKHACNRKCCLGYGSVDCAMQCEQPCNRGLPCGTHKCAQTCHAGPCYPCTLSVEVKCRCRATVIKVPCGRERQVKPPKCSKACQVAPVCKHTSREPHRCHQGQCPPCRQICQLALPCGHHCQKTCHKGLLVDVNEAQSNKKASTPWDIRREVKFELIDEPCPPCEWPVPVRCLGDHVTESTPCHRAGRPFDCGRACGRPVDCGNHPCTLKCHAPAHSKKGHPCEICERKCELKRPEGCSHPCPLPCHPAPCPECRLIVKVLCHCKLNEKLVPCPEWRQADSENRLQLSSCGNQCPKLMDCGHPCSLTCHLGNCSSPNECKRKIQIKCRCGRKSAKIQCCQKSGEGKLDCDVECDLAKKQRLEEKSKNSAEFPENSDFGEFAVNLEENQQQQPQILLARRRRKKKPRSESESDNASLIYRSKYCIFGGLVILVGLLFFYAVRLSGL